MRSIKYRDQNSSYSSQNSSISESEFSLEEYCYSIRKISLAPSRFLSLPNEHEKLQSLSDVEELPPESGEKLNLCSSLNESRKNDKELQELYKFIDHEYDMKILGKKVHENKESVIKFESNFNHCIEISLFNSNISVKIGLSNKAADITNRILKFAKIFLTIVLVTYLLFNYFIFPFIFNFL